MTTENADQSQILDHEYQSSINDSSLNQLDLNEFFFKNTSMRPS